VLKTVFSSATTASSEAPSQQRLDLANKLANGRSKLRISDISR
jgi:hypothetical protein